MPLNVKELNSSLKKVCFVRRPNLDHAVFIARLLRMNEQLTRIIEPGGGGGHAGAVQLGHVAGLVSREYRFPGRHQTQAKVTVRVDRHFVPE